MGERNVIICDLDGTLALDHGRAEKYLRGPEGKQWDLYFSACDQDLPNIPVIQLLQWVPDTHEIWIISGRSSKPEVYDKTLVWLEVNNVPYDNLVMREANDRTNDFELKIRWLDEYNLRDRVLFVLEDRRRMVDAWRATGLAVFQVAPGEF
jgi:hypothetical protein